MIDLYKLQNIYNQIVHLLPQFKLIHVKELNRLPNYIDRIDIGENRMSLYVGGIIQNINENDLRGASSIKQYAFKNDGIINIIIPDSVTSIGDYMCSGNGTLESIVIGNNVTYLPRSFENCVNLRNVVLGNNMKTISNNSFTGCSNLTTITIPNSVKSIGGDCFKEESVYTRMHFRLD